MKIISYLRPIWEGKDNKPSIRRVFAIAFLIGAIKLVEKGNVDNNVLITLCGTILILLGLITYDNLQSIKNGIQTNTNTN